MFRAINQVHTVKCEEYFELQSCNYKIVLKMVCTIFFPSIYKIFWRYVILVLGKAMLVYVLFHLASSKIMMMTK